MRSGPYDRNVAANKYTRPAWSVQTSCFKARSRSIVSPTIISNLVFYIWRYSVSTLQIPESFMEALLLDSFLETSLDDLFHLRHPISPSDERHRRSALQFLSEAHTVEWVEARNVLNGFAPSALDMFQIYKCHLLGTDEIDVRARAARKFATTMRKRWGLSFCLFQPHDETTQSERWEKVRSSDFIIVWRILWRNGSRIGPRFGSKMGTYFANS